MKEDFVNLRNYFDHRYNRRYSLRRTGFFPEPFHFKDKELPRIKEYLMNPTHTGIWQLKFEWINLGGISKEIYNDEFGKISNVKSNSLRLNQDDIKKVLITESFIFCLFLCLTLNKKSEKKEFEYFLEREYEEHLEILKILDISKLKRKYRKSLIFFKENIFFAGINPVSYLDKLFRIKSGFLLYIGSFNRFNRDRERYYYRRLYNRVRERKFMKTAHSLEAQPLEDLIEFYKGLGLVKKYKIRRYFSPEEIVFSPYIYFLSHSYRNFINKQVGSKLEKSIDLFIEEEEYEHCISTIGIMAEDVTIQIYETFFREISPRNHALGKMINSIHAKTNKNLGSKKQSFTFEDSLKKLDNLIRKNQREVTKKEILQLVKDTLSSMQIYSKLIGKTNQILEMKKFNSIFPIDMSHNLEELVKYRNDVSHKTTIRIEKYEALRATYCFVTLMLWWKHEQDQINWKEAEIDILKKSIQRNSQLK